MTMRRMLLFVVLLAGCNPLWDIGAGPGWDDEEGRSRRRPMPAELRDDQVYVEMDIVRVASEEDAFMRAVLSYCDSGADSPARWKENGMRLCSGRAGFRASFQALLRKHKSVQRTTYGLMVRTGSTGKLWLQEVKPRGRLEIWTGGRKISVEEWVNVMGGLEVRPVIMPGEEVELTMTPLVHYYEAGAAREVRVLDLSTEVRVPRERALVVSSLESREHSFGATFLSGRRQERSEKIVCILTVW